MGFSRQEYWIRLSFSSPGDLRDPGIEPRSPAMHADSLPSEPPGKPRCRLRSQAQKLILKSLAAGYYIRKLKEKELRVHLHPKDLQGTKKQNRWDKDLI